LTVLEQVRADIVRAMKAGEKDLVGALKLLQYELQRDEKEGAGDEIAVLRREHKRRLEAATQFAGGGRNDLALQEESEAKLIATYLPPELDDEQLHAIVADAIDETGASSPRDMGPVMKIVMDRAGGLVDGKRASTAVRDALAAVGN
jgi:uncharacterized protein YqeY